MGSGQITKNLINLDLIKMTQFCLKIYDFAETPQPMGGCMGGSVGQWVGSGHITKYRITLDLVETIQFCLKIYVLLRHPHLCVGGWVVGWVSGWGYVILLNIA